MVLLVAAHKETGSGPVEMERLKQENAKLVAANAILESRVAELERSLAEKNAIINALATMAGMPVNRPEDIAAVIAALKRGFPACADPNTLVEAEALDRRLTLRIMIDVPDLQVMSPGQPVVLRKGQMIAEPVLLGAFLKSVRQYGNQSAPACRFDYRLTYATAEDYLLARDSLERFMYPERITRVPR